jgi:hypothetical protein
MNRGVYIPHTMRGIFVPFLTLFSPIYLIDGAQTIVCAALPQSLKLIPTRLIAYAIGLVFSAAAVPPLSFHCSNEEGGCVLDFYKGVIS